MDKAIDQIKILFRLYMSVPSQDLASKIKTVLTACQNQKQIIITNDQLFVQLFTSLLPIYASNKKNYHQMFFPTVEINISLSKVIKIETVELLKRILRIITDLLIDINKDGDLTPRKQNDTIIYHILSLLNSIIAENSVVFGLLLNDPEMSSFYGYLCATIKLMAQTNNVSTLNECLTFYNYGPNYLSQKALSLSDKKAIANTLLLFLPGILSVVVDIFKNKSHLKTKLKCHCLKTLYFYLGVLLDDRWFCIKSIGNIDSTIIENKIDDENESKQRIAALLREITMIAAKENTNDEMCLYLAKIVNYHYKNCHQLDLNPLLLDISTKLLTLNPTNVVGLISTSLKHYSSLNEQTREYVIGYYACLFKKSIDTILKHDLNVMDSLKLILVCLNVAGNYLCIDRHLLKEFLEFVANLISYGQHINKFTPANEIRLYRSSSNNNTMINFSNNPPAEISMNSKGSFESLTDFEMELINNLLHLMVVNGGLFVEITSICMDTIENQPLINKWPFLYIINTCLKTHNSGFTNEQIITSSTINIIDVNYLNGLIETVHDCIFGNQQGLLQQPYPPYLTPRYQSVLKEVGITLNSTQMYDSSNSLQHIQMCYQIFNFVKESSNILLLKQQYIDSYFIRTLYILLIIRCTLYNSHPTTTTATNTTTTTTTSMTNTTTTTNISDVSLDCLTAIANNIGYQNLQQLLIDYKELIIDEISQEMRYLSWNNKAPLIFTSFITIVENEPCINEFIDPLIDVFIGVVEDYQDEGFLYCYSALYSYVELILKLNNSSSSSSSNIDSGVTNCDPSLSSTKSLSYQELYPALNDNETLLDFYKKYISKNVVVVVVDDDDDDDNKNIDDKKIEDDNVNGEESLQKCPPHLQRVYKIMSLCTHFLNSKSETLQIMIHQLCAKCVMVFDNLELVIYPLMHKLWEPLLYSITNSNDRGKRSITLAGSVYLLGVMCEFSGTFLKGRVLEQFFPVIQRLYSSVEHHPCNVNIMANICHSTPINNSFEFEIALIQLIPKLVRCFDLKGVQLNFLANCCVQFVQKKFPSVVKKEAVKSLYELNKIDPYTMDTIKSIEGRLNWDKLFSRYYLKD